VPDSASASEEPDADEPVGAPDGGATPVPEPPPTLPGRGAFLLAFGAVILAGFMGAVIGFGLGDITARGNSGVTVALYTLVGAVLAAGGVGVVAVLTLRAMAEWKSHPPQ